MMRWYALSASAGRQGTRAAPMPAIMVGLVALVLFAGPASAEISRQQAIEIAFDLIVPANLDHDVTAFLANRLLMPGDAVWPWDDASRVRTITAPTWFCWINDSPQAFFEHPTRYAFIDAVTGAVEVVVEGWWPVLNGDSLFMSDAEQNDPAIVIYSCIHTSEPGGAP